MVAKATASDTHEPQDGEAGRREQDAPAPERKGQAPEGERRQV